MTKKLFKEAFHCHWMEACKVLLFKCKGPVDIKTFISEFQHHLLKIGIKCSIFKKLGDISFHEDCNQTEAPCKVI